MRETTLATKAVDEWLLLDADDPACNDARDVVEALGVGEQQEAARSASALEIPLVDTTEHCADESQVARALADLRNELDALEPPADEQSWLTRAVSKIPGVGSPTTRYAQRLASSRARVDSIIESLEGGRAVLSRDNITLRSDLERLVELSASLEREIDRAQQFDDALVFAIDVELPFGDERRPLFEDELLVTVRRRLQGLGRALAVNQRCVEAIDSVMRSNRELISGIGRTRDKTLAALAVASTVGAEHAGTRAAFGEIDAALREVELRRREALPSMERTVRAVTDMAHQET